MATTASKDAEAQSLRRRLQALHRRNPLPKKLYEDLLAYLGKQKKAGKRA
jgi:hypothetical protein